MLKIPIVIVEDDHVIAELIEYNLKNEGFVTEVFASGDLMVKELNRLETSGVSLFILDVMMPGMDGFEVCALLRRKAHFDLTPILMLTARATETDKVTGLETGADDYLTKPFGIRELLSRVHSLVRRYAKIYATREKIEGEMEAESPDVITIGHVSLDDARHRVYLDGEEIEMTNREYELLKFLMRNSGIAYTRDELLNHVWGFDYAGETRTVDVHIRQLRRKLERDDKAPTLIETVRGRGYRFYEENA